jgi:hypothetical protein
MDMKEGRMWRKEGYGYEGRKATKEGRLWRKEWYGGRKDVKEGKICIHAYLHFVYICIYVGGVPQHIIVYIHTYTYTYTYLCIDYSAIKILVWHRDSPLKSVILKYDLLLVFQKWRLCLYTESKCQFDNEVHRQKQSYWTWRGFYIQKQSCKWHTQSRLLLSD